MKHLATKIAALTMLFSSQAHAVPSTVTFTGRLTASSGPVSGNVSVTFALYATSAGGTSVWTETRSGLTAVDGLVYVELGATNPLDDAIFDGGPLYLEMVVGGETLSPRVAVRSVPYAIRAGVAESADKLGTLAPDDVITSVIANGGISVVRNGTTVSITGAPITGSGPIAVNNGAVSLTTCAAGQIYKMVGSTWSCADQGEVSVSSGGGLAINSSGQIGLTTCAAGQVLKAGTLGSWACAAEAGTTYSVVGNGGVTINGSNQIGLTTCAAGQVLKASGAGTWNCAADIDTNTSVATIAGAGLRMVGNSVGLDSCPTGQVLVSTGPGTWGCSSPRAVITSSLIKADFNCSATPTTSTSNVTCSLTGTWDACFLTRVYGLDSDDVDGFGCTISGSGSSWSMTAMVSDGSSQGCTAKCLSF